MRARPGGARLGTNDFTHGLRTKLLNGLEEHHCKVGVLLASQQDAPPACLTTEHPIKEVSSMSFPGRARVGGC